MKIFLRNTNFSDCYKCKAEKRLYDENKSKIKKQLLKKNSKDKSRLKI